MNLPASSHLHETATVFFKRQNSNYFITSEIIKNGTENISCVVKP
jgi:hypothetical protein